MELNLQSFVKYFLIFALLLSFCSAVLPESSALQLCKTKSFTSNWEWHEWGSYFLLAVISSYGSIKINNMRSIQIQKHSPEATKMVDYQTWLSTAVIGESLKYIDAWVPTFKNLNLIALLHGLGISILKFPQLILRCIQVWEPPC